MAGRKDPSNVANVIAMADYLPQTGTPRGRTLRPASEAVSRLFSSPTSSRPVARPITPSRPLPTRRDPRTLGQSPGRMRPTTISPAKVRPMSPLAGSRVFSSPAASRPNVITNRTPISPAPRRTSPPREAQRAVRRAITPDPMPRRAFRSASTTPVPPLRNRISSLTLSSTRSRAPSAASVNVPAPRPQSPAVNRYRHVASSGYGPPLNPHLKGRRSRSGTARRPMGKPDDAFNSNANLSPSGSALRPSTPVSYRYASPSSRNPTSSPRTPAGSGLPYSYPASLGANPPPPSAIQHAIPATPPRGPLVPRTSPLPYFGGVASPVVPLTPSLPPKEASNVWPPVPAQTPTEPQIFLEDASPVEDTSPPTSAGSHTWTLTPPTVVDLPEPPEQAVLIEDNSAAVPKGGEIASSSQTRRPTADPPRGDPNAVQVGEIFRSRYEIVRKLGAGDWSTVWLAFDARREMFVALKVSKETRAKAMHEVNIYAQINRVVGRAAWETPGGDHHAVIRMDDSFEAPVAGGHNCIMAFEVLGKDLLSLITYPNGALTYSGVPIAQVKCIARATLQGLSFLHDSLNTFHCDLKPENVLLKPSLDVDSPLRESIISYLTNRYGRTGVSTAEIVQYLRSAVSPEAVKIIDLGAARAVGDTVYSVDMIQTLEYRSPEVVLGFPQVGTPIDVWSVACIMWELLTGVYLFNPGEDKPRNPTHVSLFASRLGDFPLSMSQAEGKHVPYFFDKSGQFRYPRTPHVGFSDLEGKYGFSSSEAEEIVSFLAPMLALNPKERVTAREHLNHPWLQSSV